MTTLITAAKETTLSPVLKEFVVALLTFSDCQSAIEGKQQSSDTQFSLLSLMNFLAVILCLSIRTRAVIGQFCELKRKSAKCHTCN